MVPRNQTGNSKHNTHTQGEKYILQREIKTEMLHVKQGLGQGKKTCWI